jgi:hypothetical protein
LATFINPNTGTLPIFRARRDADLTTAIYGRSRFCWNETEKGGNPWRMVFKATLFHMTDDSDLFRTRAAFESKGWELDGNVFARDKERILPLYEAKMVDFFNHRAADVVKSETAVNRQNQPRYLDPDELHDADRLALPLNWIAEDGMIEIRRRGKDVAVSGVDSRLNDVKWHREWLWCATSQRPQTSALPSLPSFRAPQSSTHVLHAAGCVSRPDGLIATQSSLIFDFVSRQKVSDARMKLFIWKQLPVPPLEMLEPHVSFITPRAWGSTASHTRGSCRARAGARRRAGTVRLTV